MTTKIGFKKFVIIFILILTTVIGGVACDEVTIVSTPGGQNGDTADWYEIYFTNPSCTPESERRDGLDETIAQDLLQAENRVDIAAFDLDAELIVDALIELVNRRVNVRVVTDDDNFELPSIDRLQGNGITVVEDGRSALMHNKFIAIDGRFLWVGSMNYTSNGVYCNNNNLVRFDSPRLAANYTAEMNEMFNDGSFGPTSPQNTPNQSLNINGVHLENYFGSETKLAPIIAQNINSARSEILFMAFSFTNEEIGDTMLAKAEAGVNIKGVFETTGSDTMFSYYPIMLESDLSNVEVRQDGNNQIMHHKVIIIDRETVIFGSFNFSNNANDSNDENIIIVHDPTFTGFFVEEFEAVWSEAKQ